MDISGIAPQGNASTRSTDAADGNDNTYKRVARDFEKNVRRRNASSDNDGRHHHRPFLWWIRRRSLTLGRNATNIWTLVLYCLTSDSIGPKSNSEPVWRWGSFRPLFVDARKSNEYRTGNKTRVMFALLGGRNFQLTTEFSNSVSGLKIPALPPH